MRESGILLHITSLPSPGGIGTLGQAALDFCSFLHRSGMSVWQVLPVGPTGYAQSPYQSTSSFAGNPMMIDLAELANAGYLSPGEMPPEPEDPDRVDFDALIPMKTRSLRLAFERAREDFAGEMFAFAAREADWLSDYALFMALKEHFGGIRFSDWPDADIKKRTPRAMERYRVLLRDEIEFQIFLQYLFDRQWRTLKRQANGMGIRLFGDMPIYAAEDSCDVWANPELFALDPELRPKRVAGVPPDYFCEDGQLWGNPVYNWKRMKEDGFSWWIRRLRKASEMFDLIRIDHFIGFGNYYSVRAGLPNARVGKWKKGPGKALFRQVRRALPGVKIVAEDLGVVSPRVVRLLRYTGYPGMKIMTFGFGTDERDANLPANYPKNCVAYTGTHDNETLRAWYDELSDAQRALMRDVLRLREGDRMQDAFLEALFTSKARLVVVPMQDVLFLGSQARMNRPGTVGDNWLWRMRPDAATELVANKLRALNSRARRGKKR